MTAVDTRLLDRAAARRAELAQEIGLAIVRSECSEADVLVVLSGLLLIAREQLPQAALRLAAMNGDDHAPPGWGGTPTKEDGMRFGDRARDKVTGFEGIVIGRTEWITGCDQYALQPQGVNTDGKKFEAVWFDVQRLEVTEQAVIALPKPVTASESG